MHEIYNNEDELISKTKQLLNVPFKNLINEKRDITSKGGIGQLIEENGYGLKVNNKSVPDFENLGVELKTTPVKSIRKNGKEKLVSKERLVFSIISYAEENLEDFYKSKFWDKNKKLLILYYQHNKEVPQDDWYINKYDLIQLEELEDFQQIKKDWYTIANKIKNGKAHELSESDTRLLAACTKGANAQSSYTSQPFSDILAKRRAYSFKPAYMSYLYDKCKNVDDKEQSIPNVSLSNIEKDMLNTLDKYFGLTTEELANKFDIKKKADGKFPKSINNIIINKIFNSCDLDDTVEFKKLGFRSISVNLEPGGNLKESVSIPTFKLENLHHEEDWTSSELYTYLSTTKFLINVFQKQGNGNSIYVRSFFWSMPEDDINKCEPYWKQLKNVLIDGINFTIVDGGTYTRVKNNLPKQKDSDFIHIRPHAGKAAYLLHKFHNDSKNFHGGIYEKNNINKDGDKIPNTDDYMTKQSFWLSNKYLIKVIEKEL